MYRFRPLREKDKPALFTIIKRFNDVPLKWRSMYVVSNYSSGVHVATCYNRIVGMVHITKTSSYEGWLESAYIVPAHRGQGVGSAFAKYQISQSKLTGTKILRVATGNKNKRVQHLMTDKFGFSRPYLWHRVKITGRCHNNIVPSVRHIDPEKVSECWSYISHHIDYRKSSGLITSNQDNCWWTGLDIRVLARIIASGESLVYLNQNQIKGILLVKKSRGMNFNCYTALQAYTSSNVALENLVKKLVAANNTAFMSVSKDPSAVVNKLKNDGVIKESTHHRWVVMEKQLLY